MADVPKLNASPAMQSEVGSDGITSGSKESKFTGGDRGKAVADTTPNPADRHYRRLAEAQEKLTATESRLAELEIEGLNLEREKDLLVFNAMNAATLAVIQATQKEQQETAPKSEGREQGNITPAPRKKSGLSAKAVEQVPPVPTSNSRTDKGNRDVLSADGKLKRAVTLDAARRFGGVSRRAIDEAARKGRLKTEGSRQQRRVLVESLLEYFPPEK